MNQVLPLPTTEEIRNSYAGDSQFRQQQFDSWLEVMIMEGRNGN